MATVVENQIENLWNRLRGSQLGQFFKWWFDQLGEMLPAGIQARMQHAKRRVLLQLNSNELGISEYESGVLQELEVLPLNQDPGIQRQRLSDLLHERELSESARDLLLPESRILHKEVMMPAAAEANLRQALAFEMDRQTPFQADQVFFDYRVLHRDRDTAQLKIDLFVTLRPPVLEEMKLLGPLGMAPSGVDVDLDGSPAGLNLLPPDHRQKIVNSKSRVNLLLAAATVVLLALVMIQSILLRQHQLNEVQLAIDEVREEAMQVQQIRDRISDAGEAAVFMQSSRATSLPTVQVLAEVTRILPDDTYLDRLLVGSNSVQMQGKSQNAQQLIEIINTSPIFVDASFRGPTRLDSRTRTEIFDVTASLVVEEGD
jgi:general secretion pathway protein L